MRFPWKLALLAQERVHPVVAWVPLGLVLWLAGSQAGASFERSRELVESGPPLGAWVRSGAWTVLAFLGTPLLVGRAAGFARRFRRADAEWLAPTPLSSTSVELALLAGAGLGAFLLVGLAALAAEVASPAASGLRWIGAARLAPMVLAEGTPELACSLEVPPEVDRTDALADGARLRIRPTIAPGSGPAVSLRASLSSAGGDRTLVEARIHGRSTLELPVPDARGEPLRFALERSGPGAVLVLGGASADLLRETASDRSASLELGLRAWLVLTAWMALAAGLGAWIRPALAVLLVLSLAIHAATLGPGHAWLPGGDLALAYELVGQGIVPAPMSIALVLADVGGMLAGFALLHAGLRRGGAA
jgi:hypothetical protein